MRIWKWTLGLTDIQSLPMPEGAKVLTVQMQHGALALWALVDENAPQSNRSFAIYGTGNPMPQSPGEYVGTFQLRNGDLVFHVFEPA